MQFTNIPLRIQAASAVYGRKPPHTHTAKLVACYRKTWERKWVGCRPNEQKTRCPTLAEEKCARRIRCIYIQASKRRPPLLRCLLLVGSRAQEKREEGKTRKEKNAPKAPSLFGSPQSVCSVENRDKLDLHFRPFIVQTHYWETQPQVPNATKTGPKTHHGKILQPRVFAQLCLAVPLM